MKQKLVFLPLLLTVCFAACQNQQPSAVSKPSAGVARVQAVGTPLNSSDLQFAYYPRVIRLAHNGSANGRLVATFDSRAANAPATPVFESTDDGNSWREIARFSDTSAPRICCSGLYELPQAFGNNPAGTLFWATSVGIENPRGPTAIRIWRSTNQGYTWSFYTTAATGNTGLWEPEFAVSSGGQLVMYFSSEEYKGSGYNQVLAQRTSSDGLNWGSESIIVGVNDGNKRPGMPVVRKLPNGSYFMTYEVCGLDCDVYSRTSSDGVNWGTASNLGTRIESSAGNHFSHAPTVAWANDASANGKLVVVGQLLQNNGSNANAGGSGKTLMVNSSNGAGTWTEIPAPVEVPSAYDNPCPNYASPLLPSTDGTRVLELALDYDAGICRAYYATGSLSGSSDASFNDSQTGTGNNQFEFSSGWNYGASCGAFCFNGDDHYSNTNNATVNFRFTGTQVKLYGAKDPGHGIAAISIDGGSETNVDYYASSRQGQQLMYTSPTLSSGSHTVKVRLTGTKNAASSGTYITVDRADIAGSSGAETSSLTVLNNNAIGTGNNQLEFSSNWVYGPNCGGGCYNGDDHYANATNATLQIRFTGTQVKLYGAKDPGHGIAAISIDNGSETNVDYYAPNRIGQQVMYVSPTLPSGSHTLKLRVTGTKNSASSNTFITVDRADVFAATTTLNDNTTGTGSNQFDYSSGWNYGPSCGGACFNGDDHYTTTANATVQVRFTGTQISLYGAKDPAHGIAAISIDGGAEINVDYYASSRTGQQVMFVSPTLTQGAHTLKLRVTGTKNAASSNTFITVDRTDVN
jgi:hypothetical protein